MDPHNSNIYPMNTNKDNEIFGGYVRNPCAQQTSQRHFLPPYAMPNNMSQSIMYNTHQNQSVYNIMYPHQPMYRNQNTFTSNFSQPMDWPETCMKNNGYKEKYLDEKKKENCCVENITTDVYKTKNVYNYNKNGLLDAQWYYGNCDGQKYTELPSCSQITTENSCCNIKESKNIKSVKYCSIQKLPETDPKLFGYPKQYENNVYLNQYNKLSKEYPSCSQITQTCNLYSTSTCLEIDKKILLDPCEVQNICDVLPNQYYQNPDNSPYVNVPKILDKSDEVNGGESDIVVEDSDEDTDESEEIEKELLLCLVCNVASETNFYDISSERTVTSYSQTKVSEKLFEILGWISSSSKNICGVCMTVLNKLDNLEIQLGALKQELVEKYKKGATKLSVNNKESMLSQQRINKVSKISPKIYKKTKLKAVNFKCRICMKIFSLQRFYKYHMSKHKHKVKKTFSCRHCEGNFPTKLKLMLHSKTHDRKCFHCNEIILETSKHKCEEKKRLFICHICGKTFKTNTNLKEHENLCSGDLPYKCTLCEKCFPSYTKMNQHNKLLHEKTYTNECKICKKGFVKKSDYKTHLITHSTEKKFRCKVCGKFYKSLSNLNHHKKIHSDKLPYVCRVCQKGFLRKVNLESHLNIHNGIKPFSCTMCEKKFVSQKNLDAHLKVHNGTMKKKSCTVCGKQLIHGLEEHMRIHSNFKAFECVECFMKFLTKGALAKHIKRKHENKELDVLQI